MRDISLHILDIMQNSTAANAGRITVKVEAIPGEDSLRIEIEDNGCGMDEELLTNVTSPFATTRKTRKVGLGIPLFKASAERSGGSFEIDSAKEIGTVVTAVFRISHIDRPPLGDLSGVIADMAAANPSVEIELSLNNGERQFVYNSREISGILDGVPLTEPAVIKWMREYIDEGIHEIFGGVLSEIIG